MCIANLHSIPFNIYLEYQDSGFIVFCGYLQGTRNNDIYKVFSGYRLDTRQVTEQWF